MTDRTDGADTAPADIASAAAITGPARHPGLEQILPGGVIPELPEVEPDGFLGPLLEQTEGARLSLSHGQEVVRIDRSQLLTFARAAREAGFGSCVDVTAVDWYRHRRIRFDLVVNLLSRRHHRRLRVLVAVPADDPTVDSIVSVWPGASYGEREVFDMFGIEFAGSPDPSRILMPDEWEGHPLRKDFGVGAVPVQFKASHKVT